MYFKTQFEDRTIMVSSVAPPINPLVPNMIANLSNTHLLLAEEKTLSPYIDHIEALDLETFDRSRLQFLHAFQEIKEDLEKDFFFVDKIASHSDWQQLLVFFLKDMQDHAVILQDKLEASPKIKKHATLLDSNLEQLAEGILIIKNIIANNSYTNESWNSEVAELLSQYATIVDKTNTLNKLSPHYSNINDNLRSMAEIENTATDRISAQLATKDFINFSKMHRAHITCGDKDHLWGMVQSEQLREQSIAEHSYTPLTEYDAQQIKENLISAFKGIDTLHSPGIVNLLKASCNLLDNRAFEYLEKSHIKPEAAYDRKVEAIQKLNKRMQLRADKDVPEKDSFIATEKENVIFRNQYATGLTRFSDNIRQGLVNISKELNLDNVFTQEDQQKTINFTPLNDEVFIGKFSNDASRVILAYKMTGEHENCISAQMIPQSLLDQGIPKFEDVADSEYNISCFYSFASMLEDLKDDYIQEHTLKGKYKITENVVLDVGATLGRRHKM